MERSRATGFALAAAAGLIACGVLAGPAAARKGDEPPKAVKIVIGGKKMSMDELRDALNLTADQEVQVDQIHRT